MLRFGRSQGRNTQYLNRMTSYNEVDQLTTNNQGIAVLGKRVESSDGIHAGHAMAVAGNAKVNNGQKSFNLEPMGQWSHDSRCT